MKQIFSLYFFAFNMVILICITIFSSNGKYNIVVDNQKQIQKFILDTRYIWPVIGYYKITSFFGNREAPTTGASINHGGIDIGAPTGSNLVAIANGKVKYTGFNGAGGYTIIISHDNGIESIYCHVDNIYFPKVGEMVYSGNIIGRVGPKNVYGVSNNPYKDKNGNPTNGATTGPHLHFGIRKNGKLINPLELISKYE